MMILQDQRCYQEFCPGGGDPEVSFDPSRAAAVRSAALCREPHAMGAAGRFAERF